MTTPLALDGKRPKVDPPTTQDGVTPSTQRTKPASHSQGNAAFQPASLSAVAKAAQERAIDVADGATQISTRTLFNTLARRDDVPGANGVREVKFLMTNVDQPNPELYFLNTNNHPYHWDFANRVLSPIPLEVFNAETYFRDNRKNLAGSIIAHDNYQDAKSGNTGLYSLEFWPTDPVKAKHVALAFTAVKKAMPFAEERLRYHPAGDTQEALFEQEKGHLDKAGVSSISTSELFENVQFSALNLGERATAFFASSTLCKTLLDLPRQKTSLSSRRCRTISPTSPASSPKPHRRRCHTSISRQNRTEHPMPIFETSLATQK
jgi:hypothetical protein